MNKVGTAVGNCEVIDATSEAISEAIEERISGCCVES